MDSTASNKLFSPEFITQATELSSLFAEVIENDPVGFDEFRGLHEIAKEDRSFLAKAIIFGIAGQNAAGAPTEACFLLLEQLAHYDPDIRDREYGVGGIIEQHNRSSELPTAAEIQQHLANNEALPEGMDAEIHEDLKRLATKIDQIDKDRIRILTERYQVRLQQYQAAYPRLLALHRAARRKAFAKIDDQLAAERSSNSGTSSGCIMLLAALLLFALEQL